MQAVGVNQIPQWLHTWLNFCNLHHLFPLFGIQRFKLNSDEEIPKCAETTCVIHCQYNAQSNQAHIDFKLIFLLPDTDNSVPSITTTFRLQPMAPSAPPLSGLVQIQDLVISYHNMGGVVLSA